MTREKRQELRDAALRAVSLTSTRPWTLQTSNSYRRIGSHGDGDVLCAVTQRSDGHPDLHAAPDVLDYIIEAQPSVVLALLRTLDEAEGDLNQTGAGVALDLGLCARLIAEARADEVRPLLVRVIEIAVDRALGEVARQQGGISPPTGREARGDGVSDGLAALRTALRLIMVPMADQLEAALAAVERLKVRIVTEGLP